MAVTSDRGSRTEPAAEYVLPAPRAPGNLVVEREGGRPVPDLRELVLAGQAETRAETAGRFLDLLECQDRFLAELRSCLQELGEAVRGDSRVRLLRHCHTLGEILDWAETVQADLRHEAEQVRRGLCPVDVAQLLREIALEQEEDDTGIRIPVVETSSRTFAWADPRVLRRGLRSAVSLVRQRSAGGVAAEIGSENGWVRLRLLGLGEPRPVEDAALVEEVREMLGRRHGARLLPGPSGPAGTGLVVFLPGLSGGR